MLWVKYSFLFTPCESPQRISSPWDWTVFRLGPLSERLLRFRAGKQQSAKSLTSNDMFSMSKLKAEWQPLVRICSGLWSEYIGIAWLRNWSHEIITEEFQKPTECKNHSHSQIRRPWNAYHDSKNVRNQGPGHVARLCSIEVQLFPSSMFFHVWCS